MQVNKTTSALVLVLLGVALGCSTTKVDGAPGGGNGADAGSVASRVPWGEGCGDVLTCSFLFPAFPSSDECIRSKCSAEIEACGTDGAECARGLRCADDLMASDHASGCLTSENVDNWVCYENRFACYQDLVGQPAALALVHCVTDSGCLPRPLGGVCALPECTSAPPDSACVTCVEQTCLSSTCQGDCYTAYACIETCRKDSCDAEKTTRCQLRCTKQTELEASISEVYACIEQSCKAECCP